MLVSARPSVFVFGTMLGAGLLLTSCSREAATPTGAIAGAMAPVANVGSLLSVTATSGAAGGTVYTANPSPTTGAFSFPNLPPGTYTLRFATTAISRFPVTVTATVAAGAIVTPPIPPVTHDGIGRGTVRWTANGKMYTAVGKTLTTVGDIYVGDYGGSSLFLGAYTGPLLDGADVVSIELRLPEKNQQGKVFAGVGNYLLGDASTLSPSGQSTYYVGGVIANEKRYDTTGNTLGAVHLTSYDAQLGVAKGTFDFIGYTYTTTVPLTVTKGEFDVTF